VSPFSADKALHVPNVTGFVCGGLSYPQNASSQKASGELTFCPLVEQRVHARERRSAS
jgi:hypothetical protein